MGIATQGLVFYYDGIYNAGSGVHDSTISTWKDLSGNGKDVTVNGVVFEDNRLLFDGKDDETLNVYV